MSTRLQVLARQRSLRLMALLPIVVAATLAAGCGDKSKSEGSKASQAAARVNDNEITVHQINQILERQQGLKPEQVETAQRQALEGLIEQQLAVEKAEEQKLDRDPAVVQMLDTMRRAVLARTYLEKAATAGAGTPSATEMRKYYDEKPALFANRKLYSLLEFTVPATKEQIDDILPKLKGARSQAEYEEMLKAAGLKHNANQVTQASEGLPLAILDPLSKLNAGEALFIRGTDGFKAIMLVKAAEQPVTFEQAKPAIERFLTMERRREFAQKELKNLRTTAKVEYIGKFAEKPASGVAAGGGASAVTTQSAVAAPAASEAASDALDADSISKGLSGLK